MYSVEEPEFAHIVGQAIDAIPSPFAEHIQNLVFTVESLPNEHQRKVAKLLPHQTLFGLYEGIPITKRGSNYSLVLPDKITIFQIPHEHASHTRADLVTLVHKTVWHEVAHYYGLDHSAIEAIEQQQHDHNLNT